MIKLNKDNRGLSLIELIISLLILSMLVLAVVTSLTTSLKVNDTAGKVYYAERAAANIVEELEYRGYSSIAYTTYSSPNKKWDTGSGVFTLHEGGALSEAYYTFANEGDLYKEGTEEYIAKITFDKTDYDTYTDGANNYTFAAINDFAADTSILINPEISGINFDDAASVFFLQSYRDNKYQAWLTIWQDYDDWYITISDESDRRVDEGQPAIKITDRNDSYFTVEGNAFMEKPPAFSCPDPDMDAFRACIDKSFILTLDHKEEDNTLLKSATCKVRYTFTDKAELGLVVLQHEREFAGYTEKVACNDATAATNSRSVYLLYRPIDEDFARDRITVINNVETNGSTGAGLNVMNVFLVVQNKTGDSLIDVDAEVLGVKKHLSIELPLYGGEGLNHLENLRVCSQAHLTFLDGRHPYLSSNTDAGGTAITIDSEIGKNDRLLTTVVKGTERVYTARVAIYGARKPDEMLTELVTTIVER